MPISSLPDSTLRAITSTLVLNDAVSVVKELVDNALDANATSIAIEISANTLDIIQVKDNGTGIGVEDRQLICKKGCTSKIITIDDLARLGGTFLGFRGEALGSIANISDSVTLITRIDGETAGSMLTYGSTGALLSCTSASHPIGSTFKIKEFLKSVPVRKQAALKNVSRTLATIKKLLQSYAFARGTVRFAFRVLKGKNDKANWSFSPVVNVQALDEIATRIFGTETCSRYKVEHIDGSQTREGAAKDREYSILALLIDVDEESGTIPNTGHFISIDGRPMSSLRSITKEIVKLYRQYTRNAAGKLSQQPTAFDPLLAMHIICPPESYDVNVEPAKDEVMFIDPQQILSAVDSLFRQFYGELLQSVITPAAKRSLASVTDQDSSFNLLLARKPPPTSSMTETYSNTKPLISSTSQSSLPPQDSQATIEEMTQTQSKLDSMPMPSLSSAETEMSTSAVFPSMYGFDEEVDRWTANPLDSPTLQDLPAAHENDISRNPWSLAKMNTPARISQNSDQVVFLSGGKSIMTAISPPTGNAQEAASRPTTLEQRLQYLPQLPSPITSPCSFDTYQNPGPPNRSWVSYRTENNTVGAQRFTNSAASPATHDSGDRGDPLDSLKRRKPIQNQLFGFKRISNLCGLQDEQSNKFDRSLQPNGIISNKPALVKCSTTLGTRPHPMHEAPVYRPFRSPLMNGPEEQSFNRGESRRLPTDTNGGEQVEHSRSRSSELDQIMSFEHRKKAVHAQQRQDFDKLRRNNTNIARLAELQQSAVEDLGDSLELVSETDRQVSLANFEDSSRRNVSIGITSPLDGLVTITEITRRNWNMSEDDPRTYLIKHQTENGSTSNGGLTRSGLKMRRAKSHKLPLEAIPRGASHHDLAMQLRVSLADLATDNPTCDEYFETGRNKFVIWAPYMSDTNSWQNELTILVDKMYRGCIGQDVMPANLSLDLNRMIKTHCDNI